ncbi:MAG: UDP-N-acetylmuramoyl-L-alanine--D-glutamate ligase [Planctomycetota bacterium]|nr:UDP-N-acetylmuramoyl-L-alanine--D-glutamate ligase [Planctomycetota bacterium]
MNGTCALVLGLGRFGGGIEAIRFLHRRGYHVRIADKSNGADLLASQTALADLPGLDWQLGREDDRLLDGVRLLVINPAVPNEHPLLQAALQRGIACTQEVNLFLEHYPGRVIAITGTNGKSTTTTLIHAALQHSGLSAIVGGNIGYSLLSCEAQWHKDQIAVLEISSFQLERTDPAKHRVHGAVVTRVQKDHIDRHKTLSNYHAAKARIALLATEFLVHAADDPVAAAFASSARQRVQFTSEPPAEGSMGCVDGWLCARLTAAPAIRLLHQNALRLLGDFQRENVLAAAAAALLIGAFAHAASLALATAKPLPFRLQLLTMLQGVRIYDNGISTEIESTRSALRTLTGRIHWLGGGKSKDGDFATVANGVAPFIASAHLFGAAQQPLAACLKDRVPVTTHDHLADALAAALAVAKPGDAVLFSPAFASFDQYPNFRARALEFHQRIDALQKGTVHAAGSAD